MRTRTKWAMALAAVVAAGSLIMAPAALAEEASPSPPAWTGERLEEMHRTLVPLMREMRARAFAAVADLFGMTVDELKAAWDEGRRLADLADERGVTREEIRNAVEAEARAFLDQAVADGTLTQEQADKILRHLARRDWCCRRGVPGHGMMRGWHRMRLHHGTFEG